MTLRHDIKTIVGDSWSSPTWAVILPGGYGVDLTAGWTVRAQVRQRSVEDPVHTYVVPTGITIGSAEVTLSDGTEVTTSTVELHHDATADFPVLVGKWDCEISKNAEAYTIAAGSFRTTSDVTHG